MRWLRVSLSAGRARWVLAAAVLGGAAVAATILSSSDPRPPADLEQLERAGRAGSQAQRQSEKITQNLENIAANLERGAGLTETSDEIHALTERQQRSLEALADLLEGQLGSIERTGRLLESSQESTQAVERIGAVERRRIAGTLTSLRTLERATRLSVARSADLARQAMYGARLAEDSAESFSGGP